MTYYADATRMLIYRMEGGRCEAYNFTIGRWVDDNTLWDMFIGELDVDEITEDEANAAIAKRNSEIHS